VRNFTFLTSTPCQDLHIYRKILGRSKYAGLNGAEIRFIVETAVPSTVRSESRGTLMKGVGMLLHEP
jgi:hypothetical protein